MEWILEKANRIKNSGELRSHLMEICKAHACHVTISRHLSQPGLVFDICSRVKSLTMDTFFISLAQKLGYILTISQTLTPSNLWKEIYSQITEQRICINALIVGAPEQLFQSLKERNQPNYAVVKWQSTGHFPIDSLNQAKTFRFPSEKYNELITSQPNRFNHQISRQDVNIPGIQSLHLEHLFSSTAAYHLRGENPISFISIPVALRPTPDGKPADFLSIEILWFGIPIQATMEELTEAIVLATFVTPRLLFQMDIETPYSWALRLGKQLKMTGSRVHDHHYWPENYKDFLLEHASALFLNYPIAEDIGSLQFHHGLSLFESLDTEYTCNRFDSGALLAVTTLHFICHRSDISQILTIEQDSDEAFEIPEIIIDYQSWADFLKYLRQGTAKHGDSIQQIHWCTGTLKLCFSQSETIRNLKHKVLMLYHDRENAIQRHETAKAFLNTFLPENNAHENCFMVKSHDMMLTVGGAPAKDYPLMIEFNEADKSIELQI